MMVEEPPSTASSTSAVNDTDESLSELATSRLVISETKEVTTIDNTSARLPSHLHQSLYDKNLQEEITPLQAKSRSASTLPSKASQGVPGFPDFPDQWEGEEGWVFWKRVGTDQSWKAGRRQKAEALQQAHLRRRHLRREAVNRAGLGESSKMLRTSVPPKSNKHCSTTNRKKIKAHKMDRRRKMLEQLRARRQMAALRRSLKKLKCA